MKKIFLAAVSLSALLATSIPSFAQSSSVLTSPSRQELQSVIGGMGLSMGEKLSLRPILQDMQQHGAKVKENNSLSDDQKVAQIVQIRHDALDKTLSILTPAQQKQLSAVLLPKE